MRGRKGTGGSVAPRPSSGFRRVLAGTDFSEGSLAAVRLAVAMSSPEAHAHGVHVVAPRPVRGPADPAAILGPDSETALASLRALMDSLVVAQSTYEVRRGPVEAELVSAADAWGPDVITAGRSALPQTEWSHGHVVRALLVRTAHHLLLSGEAGAHEAVPRRIAVAVDFGEAARRAAAWTQGVARAMGVAVDVVNVADPTAWEVRGDAGLPGDAGPVDLAWGEVLDRHRVALAAENREVFQGRARDVVLTGRPGTALVEWCADNRPDLLVVGHGNRVTLGGLVLGSVALEAAQRAHVPVLVWRAVGNAARRHGYTV